MSDPDVTVLSVADFTNPHPPSEPKPSSRPRNSSSSSFQKAKNGNGNNRKRNSAGKSKAPPPKRSKTTLQLPTSLAKPISRTLPVWTVNIGALTVCSITYQSLSGRDNRMANLVSEFQLLYVTILSWWFRVKELGLKFGYAPETHHHSDLRRIVTGIYLPTLCRRYVDTIGRLLLPTGSAIVPLTSSLLGANDYADVLTPADVLHLAGRPIPDNFWAIDYEWVTAWNQLTTRASRESLGFTLPTDTLDGKPEFACSYKVCEGRAGFITPLAPYAIVSHELELGASFRYRTDGLRDEWPGQYNYVLYPTHTSEDIQFAQLLSDRVVSSIVE